jgi:LmbE family N-acetylglucosaminyl deacetylase
MKNLNVTDKYTRQSVVKNTDNNGFSITNVLIGIALGIFEVVVAVLLIINLDIFRVNVWAQQGDTNVATAQQLDIDITTGGSASYLTDGSYYTGNDYAAGDTITITAESAIDSIYIIWDAPVSPWTLYYSAVSENAGGSTNTSVSNAQSSGNSLQCGTNGFLHEYVKLPQDSNSITVNIESSSRICGIYAFSQGELPDFVQTWETPCSEADILVFSTHADDEILFMGGVLATYGGQQGLPVQVCYMTNYWNGQHVREHEKLDGLWESGIRNYPVNGDFDDIYSETLEQAKISYSYDAVLEYVTQQIRTFKPNVVVTQDLNGEYGHGGHMLLAEAVCEAVDNSMNSTFFPEQAQIYGTWDVPKTYLHLYSNNKIFMDLNTPLESLSARTAIEVAKDAYLKHESQQWCWFYVSDTYEYSCAKFGLYRTTVGVDTVTGYAADGSTDARNGADMLEHITTYAQQKAEEQSRLALEASRKASESQSSDQFSEATSPAAASSSKKSSADTGNILALIIFAVMIILLILMLSFIVMLNKKRKRKKRKK